MISTNELLTIICDYFKADVSRVISKSRETELVFIRMVYSYTAFTYFKINKCKIGDVLGGRDHTTIIHSINECKRYIKEEMYELESNINNVLDIIHKKNKNESFEVLPLNEFNYLKEEINSLKLKIAEQKKEMAKLRTELALERIMNKKPKGKTKLIDYGIEEKIEPLVRHKASYSNQKSLYKELN